ncbi:hydrolase, partial [Microbacterium sp. HMWF026]|uniref:immunoglobulin-like domain-containing protein n=1 Tax=Microbacterium sp. HMWF026 TaxID=2056861 RepID=UPI000D3FAFA2
MTSTAPERAPRRRTIRRWAVLSMAVTLGVGMLAPTAALSAQAADAVPADGLLVQYPLDETSGTVAKNTAPDSRFGDGVVEGTPSWAGGGQGFAFPGGDGGSGAAIKLPDDLNVGLDAITVSFDVKIAPEQRNYYWIYGIGNTANGIGDGYLFGSGDSFHTVIASGGPATESNIQPAADATLARGVWKSFTYTQAGSTGILYEDGVERARNTAVRTTPAQIGPTSFNYLGRSPFAVDQSFQGQLRDFRVYDRALAPAEVSTLAGTVLREAVADGAAALDLGDLSAVRSSLTLPTVGDAQTTVTWASSNTAVLANDGTVTRPAAGAAPAEVTLTATVARGTVSTTRAFAVTVLPEDDAYDARAIAAALAVPHIDDTRENLTLPTSRETATISWSSSNPAVVAPDGTVTRPATGAAVQEVTLTATVTVGSATATRSFTAKVQPLPEAADTKAYFFPYFTGEDDDDDEKVRFGLSNGNDALDWTTVNDDKPVLASTLGQKGLRDPFIIRSHEGDRFYLLATDLHAYRTGLTESQNFGSRAMEIWESTDLVTWSAQRHVVVSAPEAGNTWAPEAYYDDSRGEYVVFWASNLYPSGDPSVPRWEGDSYNRMMYATTRDFVTFSPAKVWIDEQQPGQGNGTIDSTIAREDGWFYRFTVAEGTNIPRVDRTHDLTSSITPENNPWLGRTGSDWQTRQSRIGYGQTYTATSGRLTTFDEGEGTTVFRPNKGDANGDTGWFAFIDQAPYYGGEGYVPFRASSLAAGDWTIAQQRNLPTSARHGTVLPVTVAEYERILARYQADRLISADDLAVTTEPGVAPVLPATVDAVRGRGTASPQQLPKSAVAWDAVDPASLTAGARVVVTGQLADNGFVQAVVTVAGGQTPTPTPTPTPDPTASPTAEPTASPQPTTTPSASPQPTTAPSGTPQPTASASATTPIASTPAVTVSSTVIERGGTFTVTVTGLAPGEQITAELHSDPLRITGIPAADAAGRVSFSVRVPSDFAAGAHTLIVQRADGSVIARQGVTV